MNLAAALSTSKWDFLRCDFKSCIQGWWVRVRHLASLSPVTCGQTHWNMYTVAVLTHANMVNIHMKKLKTRKATSSGANIQDEKEKRPKTVLVTFLLIC